MDKTSQHLLWIMAAVALIGTCAGLWLAVLIQREWVLYTVIAMFIAPFWCALAISTERIRRTPSRHHA
ncbi:MAG: hypothetical protein F4029_08290 [Gammaproteobacteria bacterium]|nr:hypothetical protein [Gammaproteobacteria bacterium]MXY56880.1 hypothetical protein [Gammaproteobacteria bacterium]MYF29250.1 hypothetical protein [Gammaproteobacteria bacterium]MYK46213.1 hypothetical protein [Gammaproteobacteria bacterium]